LPDLRRLLSDHDLALLRQIAELWGETLAAASQREAVDELAALLLAPERVAEVRAGLPPEAAEALAALAQAGRLPAAQFLRRYGELRAMGAARRDREKPWANDPSTTEVLWYRALAGRAFFNDGGRLEEYFYVPADLRSLLYVGPAQPVAAPPEAETPGRPLFDPASPPDPPEVSPARPPLRLAAAHDAVTLLAYLQVHAVKPAALTPAPGEAPGLHATTLGDRLLQPAALTLYLHLLRRLGLAAAAPGEPLRLDPEHVQPFLNAPPAERLRQLAEAWRDSAEWNDLLQVPGLVFEGTAWRNDPLTARQAVLRLLAEVPPGVWWSRASFESAVHDRQPDYQRPAGDYDSWYIRDAVTGAYLRGFDNWERVDGALVRWLLSQPLAWLGLVDVAPPGLAAEPGFRLTPYGAALLGRAGWDAGSEEPAAPAASPIDLAPDGSLRVAASGSAHDRFQVARITEWGRVEVAAPPAAAAAEVVYHYRLSPAALARAQQKGIPPERIVQFLERACAGHPALPLVAGAVRRWERSGAEAALRPALVLKLASPELLETLRRLPRVHDLLGESLGPAAVVVRPGREGDLRAALAELGILLDTLV
jgi:hypothetical protein